MTQSFLLDTNFFIEAYRTSFPLDVVPSFWNQVTILAERGIIQSIDKVYDELARNEDELTRWIRGNLPNTFFLPSNTVLSEYKQVAIWASSRSSHYTNDALSTFMQAAEADAWLVAHALKTGYTITTHEVSRPEMKRSIKIPEPCNHFNLRFLNTIQMLRELGVRI